MIGIGTLVIAVLILSIGAAFVEFVLPEIRARKK
jgi:hypothetical protein